MQIVKGVVKRRYPYPFKVPDRELVTSWSLRDRLLWAKRRSRHNYKKYFDRRKLPFPALSPKWDAPIPFPPESVGPDTRPENTPKWFNLKDDASYDFEWCALSPRS